ncbi:MAG TPA: hypothetical protein VK856_15035, partial [Anaerolineaceae bacterium]|nr:hypothetical protein [Anaerolineaceae bacterium]
RLFPAKPAVGPVLDKNMDHQNPSDRLNAVRPARASPHANPRPVVPAFLPGIRPGQTGDRAAAGSDAMVAGFVAVILSSDVL